MRPPHTVVALFLLAAVPAAAQQHKDPGPGSAQTSAPGSVAKARAQLAPFARLVGGVWRVTFTSGEASDHSWHWGPGRYSLRKVTSGSAAIHSWAGEVLYWHPGRKQVRLLALHGDIPGIGRGVGGGTMAFAGEAAEAVFELDQPPGRRKLASRWVFYGPDKYRDTLLEDQGAGLEPLAAWDVIRVKAGPAPQPGPAVEPAARPLPRQLSVFEALLGRTWQATGTRSGAAALGVPSSTELTYEWDAALGVVSARLSVPHPLGERTLLLDAYFYRGVRTDAVHCLALSHDGGVYEGRLTVLDDAAWQLDLQGYAGDRVIPCVVRVDLERDGTLRSRVWSGTGAARILLFDLQHQATRAGRVSGVGRGRSWYTSDRASRVSWLRRLEGS